MPRALGRNRGDYNRPRVCLNRALLRRARRILFLACGQPSYRGARESYKDKESAAACARALTINAITYSSVNAILKSGLDRVPPDPISISAPLLIAVASICRRLNRRCISACQTPRLGTIAATTA